MVTEMEAEAFNATASFALQKTGEEKEMNYNERKFNMDIAAVCGLREAVIVDFIRGWLLTSDETTYRHGHLWVKCTQKTMTVQIYVCWCARPRMDSRDALPMRLLHRPDND